MYLVSLVGHRQQDKFSSMTVLPFFLVTLLTRTNFLSLQSFSIRNETYKKEKSTFETMELKIAIKSRN